MTPLSPLDLELCAAHHHRCRVTRIKGQRQASLKRLRYAGLVSFDGFTPSPSAIADWLERRNETPVGRNPDLPAESPEPEAIAEGGRRCSDAGASPPKPATKRKGYQRKTKAPLGDRRYAVNRTNVAEAASPSVDPPAVVPTAGRGAALEDPNEARPRSERSKVDIKVNTRRDPTLPPDTPLMDIRDAQVSRGYRHAAAVTRGHEQAATALVDAGVDPASQNSITSARMRAVIARRAEDARLACPIEQAMTKLRRRYTPVYGAEVSGGPAGKFYVGRKLVTKAELLAMAGRVGA